jgi:hypothetical protein
MSRVVYLENWQEQLESTIEVVADHISTYSFSGEYRALSEELDCLQELRRQVREVSPNERALVQSVVVWVSVREPLQLPQDLVQRLGEIFDIYRRFRTRLQWNG